MALNVLAFAVAGGGVWALGIFIMTWLNIFGMGQQPTFIKSYYIGYTTTPIGSVIGAVYGFFDAGIGCAVFALIYNLVAKT